MVAVLQLGGAPHGRGGELREYVRRQPRALAHHILPRGVALRPADHDATGV